jgi:hypothetical protein
MEPPPWTIGPGATRPGARERGEWETAFSSQEKQLSAVSDQLEAKARIKFNIHFSPISLPSAGIAISDQPSA